MDCYQIVQLVISGLVLVATAILAITAWKSAKSAEKSAKSAEKSAEATNKAMETNRQNIQQQVILHMLDDYGSMQMQEHLRTLWWWFNNASKKTEIMQIYREAWNTRNFDKVNDHRDVEAARRSIAWHCTKIYSLNKAGILSNEEIKDYKLVNEELSILIGFVEELDKAERGKDVYEFYRNLFR